MEMTIRTTSFCLDGFLMAGTQSVSTGMGKKTLTCHLLLNYQKLRLDKYFTWMVYMCVDHTHVGGTIVKIARGNRDVLKLSKLGRVQHTDKSSWAPTFSKCHREERIHDGDSGERQVRREVTGSEDCPGL